MLKICGLIVFTILVIVCCFQFGTVVAIVTGLIGLFTPFLIGLVMAFIINILMRFLERRLFALPFIRDRKFLQRIKRPVSIFLAIVIILGVIAAVFGFVIPQLGEAANTAIKNLEGAIPRLRDWLNERLAGYPEVLEKVNNVLSQEPNWPLIFSNILEFLRSGNIGS